ncbi:uncharacterized protein LOC143264619 isoform X3 [Megachile rotundata]
MSALLPGSVIQRLDYQWITGAPSSRRDFLRRSGQWHRSTYSPRDRATSPTRREKGRNTERLFTVKQRRTTGRVILTVSTLNT